MQNKAIFNVLINLFSPMLFTRITFLNYLLTNVVLRTDTCIFYRNRFMCIIVLQTHLKQPKWPINNIECYKRNRKHIKKNCVNLGKVLSLIYVSYLFLAFVEFWALIEEAISFVNDCQVPTRLSHLRFLFEL